MALYRSTHTWQPMLSLLTTQLHGHDRHTAAWCCPTHSRGTVFAKHTDLVGPPQPSTAQPHRYPAPQAEPATCFLTLFDLGLVKMYLAWLLDLP
jgi:hypothetical protein